MFFLALKFGDTLFPFTFVHHMPCSPLPSDHCSLGPTQSQLPSDYIILSIVRTMRLDMRAGAGTLVLEVQTPAAYITLAHRSNSTLPQLRKKKTTRLVL